jgi:hypothetical protein
MLGEKGLAEQPPRVTQDDGHEVDRHGLLAIDTIFWPKSICIC